MFTHAIAQCRKIRTVAAVLAAVAAAALFQPATSHANDARAEPTVELRVASTFPVTMPVLGEVSRILPEKIARASGGRLQLRFFEPGQLVPGSQTVDAVSDGRIDAAWAGAGWFAGKNSAFNIFSSVPFGPGVGEYLAWMYHGGGLQLAREMFREYGVHNVPCGIIPPEASGWFKQEIRTIADLKGLRMRFFGLGAKVMQRFGVETQQLPPGEILPALKAGKIDATEFSLPSMDRPLGFQSVAKYYYFPGWHQQATLFDLYINLAVWEKLPDHHKAVIELACGDAMREMISQGEALQWKALRDLQEEGVQLRRWPPSILVAFEDAWREVAAAEAKQNPAFARVFESYARFRDDHAIWRHMSFLQ
jgi:TRAP-type mannitol/chloroaromatic compound transport system substrate-binding protein